jgi:hypothetical protein
MLQQKWRGERQIGCWGAGVVEMNEGSGGMIARLSTLVPRPGPRPKMPRMNQDLAALLARTRQRLYPETLPVLVSYWLKTVSAKGHDFSWWRSLYDELSQSLVNEFPDDSPSRQALIELRTWIENEILLKGHPPSPRPPCLASVRTNLDPSALKPYINRLLSTWLPLEVARLLVNEAESAPGGEEGIPVLATALALEHLLVRARFSRETLEMLLGPALFSPQYVYPADAEILRDVVLDLLGRTAADPPPVLPAILLSVAPGSLLPADYGDAVRRAVLSPGRDGEELRVPLAPAQAREILKSDQVRIGSILVTMDGRWWESERLRYGDNEAVVYRPMGRLRIDFSADHARLRVPWPEARAQWSGDVQLGGALGLFGREWRVSRWDADAGRTWLDLMFSCVLPAIAGTADRKLQRSRPASVDMAWAALEIAVATSIVQNSLDPIEQLRHSGLIPLGRAIFALAASIMSFSMRTPETIETRLRAIRYLEAAILAEYGSVPWRILPAPVQRSLRLRGRSDPELQELMNEVFEAPPELGGASRHHAA